MLRPDAVGGRCTRSKRDAQGSSQNRLSARMDAPQACRPANSKAEGRRAVTAYRRPDCTLGPPAHGRAALWPWCCHPRRPDLRQWRRQYRILQEAAAAIRPTSMPGAQSVKPRSPSLRDLAYSAVRPMASWSATITPQSASTASPKPLPSSPRHGRTGPLVTAGADASGHAAVIEDHKFIRWSFAAPARRPACWATVWTANSSSLVHIRHAVRNAHHGARLGRCWPRKWETKRFPHRANWPGHVVGCRARSGRP